MNKNTSSGRVPGSSPIEKALYVVARREIETGEMKADAWEIAKRLSRGNEQRAIAAYVRLRVRVLIDAHQARLKGAGRA